MSNYTKSFNFRNGVQVDDSNFIVNAAGLVGIGTTKPEKSLDVFGNAKISGITSLTGATVSGVVTVGAAITMDAASGIISATKFVGDASLLTNIVAIATDGWISNTGTLSTTANVGVGTLSPTSQLDVLGNSMFVGVSTFNGITTSLGKLFATQFSASGLSTFKDEVTFAGTSGVKVLDSVILQFGDDLATSLRMGHTTPHGNLITSNGTLKPLYIQSNFGNSVVISDTTPTASGFTTESAIFNIGAGVSLKYNNIIRFETTGTGVTVTGTFHSSQGATVPSLNVAGIASANGFQGNNGGVASFPSGITVPTETVTVSLASTVGFGTTAYFKDNAKAVFGDNQDLKIYHNGAHSYVQDSGTGDLVILSNQVAIRNAAENQDLARFVQGKGVELRDGNDNIKFETSGIGASVYGQLNVEIYNGGTNGMSTHSGSLRYGNESNESAPYSTRRSLDLINYDSGNINFYLNSNSISVGETGSAFYWHKGFNSSRLMTLTGIGGSLGVGTTLPLTKLHVVGKGIITDEVTFNKGLEITDGSLNVRSGNIFVSGLGTFTHIYSDFIGNIFSNSGISTFQNLLVQSSGGGTGVITCSNLKTGRVGINQLADDDKYLDIAVNTGLGNKFFVDDLGNVGIRTTLIPDPIVPGPPGIKDVGINARDTSLLINTVGVGTTGLRNAAVDMGHAGTSTTRYMVPPTVNNTIQGQLTGTDQTSGSIPIGSIIFNSEAGQHRWWNGTTWKNLGDYS